MCEKQNFEESRTFIRPHLLKGKSSQDVRNHKAHRDSKDQLVRRRRSNTRGFLRKCQPPTCQGLPVATQTGAEGRSIGQEKDGKHREDTYGKHQADHHVGKTGAQGVKRRREVSSATCGGKKQWCLGSEEPIIPSHAWQNDVKGMVDNTWQISQLSHSVSRSFRA